MAKFFDEYHLPSTLDDALKLLARYNGRARVVAGGTDLLLDLQGEYFDGQRPHLDALIDVTQIAGANEIRAEGDWIVVGCGVTHTQIVESPLIQKNATALAEACFVVGGPQVRNVATLIGNVAHALPAADGTLALMALEAQAQIARVGATHESPLQEQWRPLASLFKGPGESAVDATREMIVAVRFRPTAEHEASAFTRVMRPQGVALPILGMAARVRMSGEEIARVTLSAGPVAPVPFRAIKTEEFLRGKNFSEETVERAAQILLNEAQPRTSPHRATKEYRIALLPTLFAQTLQIAVERASHREDAKSAR